MKHQHQKKKSVVAVLAFCLILTVSLAWTFRKKIGVASEDNDEPLPPLTVARALNPKKGKEKKKKKKKKKEKKNTTEILMASAVEKHRKLLDRSLSVDTALTTEEKIISNDVLHLSGGGDLSLEGTSGSPRIAIVTMLGETDVAAYTEASVYQRLSWMTLQSLMEYSTRWGYPFFFQHHSLMNTTRQAYWSKINIIRHYLEMDFDFVLYTDIDVLILKPEKPLTDFIVDGYDIMGVNECINRNKTNPIIRSGFMLFRNSAVSHQLLSVWENSFADFERVENPEQVALELIVTTNQFRKSVTLLDWSFYHSYDTCHGGESAFSMHFPGAYKLERVARMVAWLEAHCSECFIERPITQLLGFGPSMRSLSHEIVGGGLKSLDALAVQMPTASEMDFLQDTTLTLLHEATYQTFGHTSMQLQEHRSAVWRYDESSYFWAIPNVIYFTVPDSSSMHPEIEKRLERWQELNPSFKLIVYDDIQVSALARSLFSMKEDAWESLEPVQRADIWRYLVIHSFGGWYFDVDVECSRSILDWGHRPSDTLVVGIEADNLAANAPPHEGARPVMFAQYAFGAAPQHPALRQVLDKIVAFGKELPMSPDMNVEERLHHVLATTGPVLWTDTLAEHFVISLSTRGDQPKTPMQLHEGGRVMNTCIFSIGGFGAGQYHSASPKCNEEGVNACHLFGGSRYFRGASWQSKSIGA